MVFDCVIIGGGIAGLQGAIQLGRYDRNVLVVDNHDGRSSICHSYHNILGWPNGISGLELREIGVKQAKNLGVTFVNGKVCNVKNETKHFQVVLTEDTVYEAKTVLLATGVKDNLPSYANMYPCLGKTIYVCPDCDGYEVKGRKTIVLGSGDVGANMALTLHYWTKDIIFINDGKMQVGEENLLHMKEKNIQFIDQSVKSILAEKGKFYGVVLVDGNEIKAERGFVAYGGNEVKSELASQLGVEMLMNKHIVVDPRTKMTNVKNVWAAGDVVAHSEQVTIAMGEGSQAAIWIHKTLLQEETD